MKKQIKISYDVHDIQGKKCLIASNVTHHIGKISVYRDSIADILYNILNGEVLPDILVDMVQTNAEEMHLDFKYELDENYFGMIKFHFDDYGENDFSKYDDCKNITICWDKPVEVAKEIIEGMKRHYSSSNTVKEVKEVHEIHAPKNFFDTEPIKPKPITPNDIRKRNGLPPLLTARTLYFDTLEEAERIFDCIKKHIDLFGFISLSDISVYCGDVLNTDSDIFGFNSTKEIAIHKPADLFKKQKKLFYISFPSPIRNPNPSKNHLKYKIETSILQELFPDDDIEGLRRLIHEDDQKQYVIKEDTSESSSESNQDSN